MKKILFLLLFTIASYGQAVFDEGIQITNTESTTATKVNVQEANGKVNTKTINTAFNKNFGLNTGDVVGATTLLNQYGTTPIDWTATTFSSGQVVFYGGKQWIAKIATVAGDVPAVSSKWDEITFEALANKTVTVDQTIIDGSTSAVSGNAVFDALATKAPISSVHNPVTLGTANGLSLSTQQLSLGLASSGVTGALSGTDWNTFNGKFNTPTGLTANYLPKWNGSGFVDSLIDFYDGVTRINSTADNVPLSIFSNQPEATIGFKSNSSANGFNVRLGAKGEDFVFRTLNFERLRIMSNGRVLINKTADDLTNQLQVAGTISASPATTANQVPTWGQVQNIASSGVYVASISNASNISGITIGRANYMKIGNVVSVNFSGSATFITTTAPVTFEISLPFNKTLTNNGFTVGSAIPVSVGIISTGIIQHINSVSTVRVIINSSTMNGLGSISGSFMYNITD